VLKKISWRLAILPVCILWFAIYGCAGGNTLSLPDGLGRPSSKSVPKPEGTPKAAVVDFSWDVRKTEIGRDYDGVRAIVWNGNPGKSMADLVAEVLDENNIPSARFARETDIPPGIPVKIGGRVEEFRVDAKRTRGVAVEIDSSITLKLDGTGPGAPRGWGSTVSSSYKYPEPVFIIPGDVLHVLNQAANDAAEESVRQMIRAGLFPGTPGSVPADVEPAPEPEGAAIPDKPIGVEELK
jgi:hypothetical protein